MLISPGSRIGPYEVIAPIGAGGMGKVYRARDPKLGRDVAIKVLQDEYAGNHNLLKRFEKEARSASALNHPNIVTIYEIGEVDSAPYIAMELIEGVRLRDVIAAGPLPLRKVLETASCIAEGLAAAHDKGIVHRDLKPENIMLTPQGFVKILDFGLAKLMEPHVHHGTTGDVSSTHTHPGAIVGTPGYMSPEQASGRQADYRADQFSLGTILYEMATGKAAFQRATSVETMSAIIRDQPPPVTLLNPETPGQLRWIIDRCLAKDPQDRYTSTFDLAKDLRDVRDHHTDTMISEGSRRRRRMPDRRMQYAALALLGLLLLAGGIWIARDTGSDTAKPKTTERTATLLPKEKYLAVLPFDDFSGDAAGKLFSDGMAETVSARLTKVAGVQIMPPSVAAPLLAANPDLRKLARNLGANLVLRASVRKHGDQVRVTYSVLNAENGVQIAGDTVGGSSSELFVLEDQLADSVVSALKLQLTSGSAAPRYSGLVSASAQDRYLQSLGALQRYENEASIDTAIGLLAKLLDDAPESALVHAAMGRAYLYKFKLTHDRQWATKAADECERASQLDPTLPDVHVTLGELHTRTGRFSDAVVEFKRVLTEQPRSPEATLGLAEAYDRGGNLPEAEAAYRQAIELRPAYWAGYNKLGVFYLRHGRVAESLRMFERVIEFTPDNVRGYDNLGAAHFTLGDYARAVSAFEKSISIRPAPVAYSNLGTCLYFLGRFGDSAAAFEKATAMTPMNFVLWANLGDAYRWVARGTTTEKAAAAYRRAIEAGEQELSVNRRDAEVYANVALCYAKTADMPRATERMKAARTLAPDNPNIIYQAAILAALDGKTEEAVALLRRAVDGGIARTQVEREPEFTKLRNDKEFRAMIRQNPKTRRGAA